MVPFDEGVEVIFRNQYATPLPQEIKRSSPYGRYRPTEGVTHSWLWSCAALPPALFTLKSAPRPLYSHAPPIKKL